MSFVNNGTIFFEIRNYTRERRHHKKTPTAAVDPRHLKVEVPN